MCRHVLGVHPRQGSWCKRDLRKQKKRQDGSGWRSCGATPCVSWPSRKAQRYDVRTRQDKTNNNKCSQSTHSRQIDARTASVLMTPRQPNTSPNNHKGQRTQPQGYQAVFGHHASMSARTRNIHIVPTETIQGLVATHVVLRSR